MPEMSVSDLIENIPILEMRGDPRTVVKGIAYDSRDVKPGFLFAAMGGVHTDGHGYVEDALGRGATAILHARPLPVDAGAAVCIRVENPRIALSPIAAAFYKWPSRSIRTIGVTGTDGKSSTVWFITQLLGFLGRKAVIVAAGMPGEPQKGGGGQTGTAGNRRVQNVAQSICGRSKIRLFGDISNQVAN